MSCVNEAPAHNKDKEIFPEFSKIFSALPKNHHFVFDLVASRIIFSSAVTQYFLHEIVQRISLVVLPRFPVQVPEVCTGEHRPLLLDELKEKSMLGTLEADGA